MFKVEEIGIVGGPAWHGVKSAVGTFVVRQSRTEQHARKRMD